MNNIQIKKLLSDDFDFEKIPWNELREGVNIYAFYEQKNINGAKAVLLKYEASASVPIHEHTGFEYLVILRGEQEDQNGVYSKGDFIVNLPGSRHDVKSKTGCILLAIWEKSVQFI